MRIELRSKLIEAASYDESERLLRIYMTNGELREFVEVPKGVFENLSRARSAGIFYMENIRGRFPHPG